MPPWLGRCSSATPSEAGRPRSVVPLRDGETVSDPGTIGHAPRRGGEMVDAADLKSAVAKAA
jgi:hypothetical protein